MIRKLLIILLLFISGCSDASIKPENMEVVKDSQDETYDYLNQWLDSFMHDQDELLNEYNGKTITWYVDSGDASIVDNKLIKSEKADEYEKISLKAKVDGKTYVFDNICLLDIIHGYLISYFSNDEECLKLAYTYDGLLWYEANDQKCVVSASSGTKRLRDPYIMRNKDGGFYLLGTQGYDNPEIYVWDSSDLVTFNNERLLKVNASTNENKMSEKQAWAPEGFYDRIIDKYVIYWSSPQDSGMYYNYSNDLNDISYPSKLLDPGFVVIDGTIFKDGYDYNIVLKDEREPMEEYSQLFVGYSDSDYLGFNEFNMNYITGHQSEGPFIIYRGYNYILYYDDYTRFKFKALYFENFREHDFEEVLDSEIISSVGNVKHGSAIALTYREFLRINEVYNIE